MNHEIFRVPEHLEKSAMTSCSAHELHKICHVGPQIDMHMHKPSLFGPHRCTHAQDRPVRPTEVIDTHKVSANGRGSNLPAGQTARTFVGPYSQGYQPIHRSLQGGSGRKQDMLCVQWHHRCKDVCSRSLLDGRHECGDCGERWIPGQTARSPPLRIGITFPCGVRCGMSEISCGVPSPMRGSMREPSSRTGSSASQRIQCGIRDIVHNPDFHVGSSAESRLWCGVRCPMQGAMWAP